jgi:Domain of unknown function (DUF4389)
MQPTTYPVQFSVDYPDRPLNRVSTAFRIFAAIPILIVLSAVSRGESFSGGGNWNSSLSTSTSFGLVAGGLLVLGPLLMILFRQKYPRWWFDWNLQMLRFTNRVGVYLTLMDDRYPSTDEEQSVHLDFPYPDAAQDLNRWLPLVKWFLAIPHWILLGFFSIAAFFMVIGAWFAILFTGRYPRTIFNFLESVLRWNNRVVAYALIMVTDQYPPFSFEA